MNNQMITQERKELPNIQRVETWKTRKAKEQIPFSYQVQETNKNAVETKFNDPDATQQYKAENQRAALCAATGTSSLNFGQMLLEQTMAATFPNNNHDTAFKANAMHEALVAMNPQDEFEGMICVQLLILHDQSIHFMSRNTAPDQTFQAIDLNINRSTKLMRIWNEKLELLNRHRRKGEQKVTVQHVNVQTIVTTGEGLTTKRDGVAHAN